MSLQPLKITAIAKDDSGGTNIIPNAAFSITDGSGSFPQLWEEKEGVTPVSNPSTCDANGERQVWLLGGYYSISVGGGQSWEVNLISAVADLDNYDSVRALNGSNITQVSVSGGVSVGDGNGGIYSLKTGDVTSSDDGYFVLVDAGGGRWHRNGAGFGIGNVAGSENIPQLGAYPADSQDIPTGDYLALYTSFASPPFAGTNVYLHVSRSGSSSATQTATRIGAYPVKKFRSTADNGTTWSEWQKVKASASKLDITTNTNMDETHINRRLKAAANGITYTITANVAEAGDQVDIYSVTNATTTIAPGAGLSLTWNQGGAALSGSRSMAVRSQATIYFDSPTAAIIFGDGLS